MGRTDGASTHVGASGAGYRWPDRLRWTCWSANWRGGSTLDCMMRCAAPAPADSQATAVLSVLDEAYATGEAYLECI